MQRFDAPWDGTLLLSTVFLLSVMLFTATAAFSEAAHDGVSGVAVAVAVLAGAVAIGAWALSPRGFEIGGGAFRIVRNGWFGTAIPLADVRSAGQLAPDALDGATRVVVPGLFGSFGMVRSPELGALRLDATRNDGLVLVRTARRAHVLTPERPGAFVDALLAAAPDAERELGRAG